MKGVAYQASHAGALLECVPFETPSLHSKQMLIEVTHCGVCRSDLHFLENAWGDAQFPLVPGHEVVGRVVGCGNAVTKFVVGDRVGVSWQQGSCGHCVWCDKKKEGLCADLKAIALTARGGFASHMLVEESFAFHLPASIDSAHAAPLLCAGATVYHALSTHRVRKGVSVGIVGFGGLGHLALQFAVAMGASVTVFSEDPAAQKDANRLGADRFVLSDSVEALVSLKPAWDLILVATDADIDYQLYINQLRPEGVLCFVGIPQKKVAVSVFSLIIGQKSISGIPLGHAQTVEAALMFAAKHRVMPEIQLMPMVEVNKAFEILKHQKVRYRIVLENENTQSVPHI